MSLLIKALQKAEQSKDAKATDKPAAKAELSLELAPQEAKIEPESSLPVKSASASVADTAGLILSEPVTPPQASVSMTPVASALSDDHSFSLADEAGFTEPASAPKTTPTKPKLEPEPAKAAPPIKPTVMEPIASNSSAPVEAMPTKAKPDSAAQRQAAASMLSLQPSEKSRSSNNNRRSLILGGGALFLLLIVGGGFYYYLQTLDQPQLVAMQPLPKPATATTTPSKPVEAMPVQTGTVEGAGTVSNASQNKADISPPLEDKPKENPAPVAATSNETTQRAGDSIISEPKVARPKSAKPVHAPADPNGNPTKVTRLLKGEPYTNATHVAAYQAFTNGDDATAGKLYKQLLQTEPRNIDALLGLAAVAARQDRLDEAANHYQSALVLDPRNSIAQSGLIALLSQSNPTEATSRLKSLITQQPEAAYLHAALGGVYADQNQWSNAQQAYFQAFSLDAGNADYAFNLAVSLDQMRKPDLALEYYQRALGLARQGSNVDSATLESRISQLRSALGK